MQLDRISTPHEGAGGIEPASDRPIQEAGSAGRAGVAVARPLDATVWRGVDEVRAPIARLPVKQGFLETLKSRVVIVQAQSEQRHAALTPQRETR